MEKNKGGRPRYVVDYEKLQPLCEIQCTGEECANILKTSYETLNLRLKEDYAAKLAEDPDFDGVEFADGFQDYFKKHSATGKASLRRMQFKGANNGNTTMLVWLGKQHLGQSDKNEIKAQVNDYGNLEGDALDRKIVEMQQKLDKSRED